MTKANKEELLKRVAKSKLFMKHKGIKRSDFFDNVYGSMYDNEHSNKLNIWNGVITDLEFTKNLERYLEFPKKYLKEHAEFKRFYRFTEWYLKLGGETLTEEQILSCYPKFK